jgi:HlyD family secretion protein
LLDNRLISQAEFEQSDVALLQADAAVKMRDAALAEAKVDLDRTVIYAPISGVVISRRVEAGQTVAASFNTPELFQIANDLTQMQIEAAVSEADVGGVQEGQRVTFLVDAFPNRQFTGKVRQVRFAPTTNQNVVSYTTVVDVKNTDRKLRPGMTANASIITAERTNVIRVPNSALRFRPPEGAVIGSTNDVVAKSAGTNAPSSRPEGLPIPPWVAEGRRPTDEERKKFDETLTPEQREQMRVMRDRMRAQMSQGGGPGGGGMMGFGGGGSAGSAADSPGIRTVYLIDTAASQPGKPVLQAVSVRTGISDGANTEIVEGLKEGEVVVTGVVVAETTATATSTPARPGSPLGGSPFGGPRMR